MLETKTVRTIETIAAKEFAMKRKYVAFDIETAKDVPGEDFNWKPHRPLGICCAAALPADAKQANPAEVIFNGIQDMSAAMVGDFKVNDIALMALESMYRGLGFYRVIFFTMRKDKKQLQTRYGFGADIEKIVNKINFETKEPTTIFNIALLRDKDLIIENTHETHIQELIPQWYRQTINAPSFIFLPITYEKSCLGAFYADRKVVGPPLQAGQYKFMTMLRNQLILAIKFRK